MRRNYVTTFITEGVVIVSYLLAFRLVAANLGTTGFGEYSLSRRTLSLLLPLCVLGVEIGIARYVSYAEEQKSGASSTYAVSGLIMLLTGVAVMSLVLLAFSGFWAGVFFGSSRYSDLVVGLPPLLLGGGLNVAAYSYLRGLNRIQWANLVMAINNGVTPLAAILLSRSSVFGILVVMGIAWTVVSGITLLLLPLRVVDLRPRLREMARFGLPRVPGDFVALLLFAMPGILVAHAADIRIAGITAFGIAGVSMIGTALTPVSFVLLPMASRMFAAGKAQQLRAEIAEVVGLTLAGTLVVVVTLELFAGPIVSAYLGPSFVAGVDVLRLTLIGALPWGVYISLRAVIDARHVRAINARNMVIAFATFVLLAVLLPRVEDPVTSAVLAFVLALYVLAALTILEVSRIGVIAGPISRRTPLAWVRLGMLAALPVLIVISSPQRVVASAVIAAAYLGVALLGFKPTRSNRLMLAYVGVAGAWMILAWLRAKYLLNLTPDQLAYGTSKTLYFVLIVLPMSAAVAIMVNRLEDIWPAGAGQLAVGLVVGLITVALLGDRFLGAERYNWQGVLVALGTLVAVQPWLIRNLWASGALGVLGVSAIVFADARQALFAFAAALLLSAGYWTAARFLAAARTSSTVARLRGAVANRYVLLPLVLLVLTSAAIVVTIDPNRVCNCVSQRIVTIGATAGDRVLLVQRSLNLIGQNPFLGTGPGSFAGVIPDSEDPAILYAYPHNVPLEVAAETGLIGLVLLFLPLLVTWVALLRAGVRRASPEIAGLMVIVAVFLAVANVSGDIPSARGLWIFGILALKLGIDAWQTRPVEARQPVPARADVPSPAS
jgi:O-antigen/teichoic acid export membrane protein/O-antigen ligase